MWHRVLVGLCHFIASLVLPSTWKHCLVPLKLDVDMLLVRLPCGIHDSQFFDNWVSLVLPGAWFVSSSQFLYSTGIQVQHSGAHVHLLLNDMDRYLLGSVVNS
jgi:hypothetical protein